MALEKKGAKDLARSFKKALCECHCIFYVLFVTYVCIRTYAFSRDVVVAVVNIMQRNITTIQCTGPEPIKYQILPTNT